MAEETTIVSDWLFDTLNGDSVTLNALFSGIASRVYDTDIDQEESSWPVIVFQLQAAGDDMATNGARRIYANLVYVVKVIGKDHAYAQLAPVVDRVDDLLHRVSNALPTGGRIIACTRERPFKMSEIDSGIVWRHLGGVYRILAKEE